MCNYMFSNYIHIIKMIKDNDNFKSSDIDINTPNEFAKIIGALS